MRIAKSVVAGKPLADVAREEDISREWASREANHPETKLVIANLIDQHFDAASALVARAIEVIRESFDARLFSPQKIKRLVLNEETGKHEAREEVEILDVGADHYARLTGAKRMIELLVAGRPKQTEDDDSEKKGILTWEQLEKLSQQKRDAALQ